MRIRSPPNRLAQPQKALVCQQLYMDSSPMTGSYRSNTSAKGSSCDRHYFRILATRRLNGAFCLMNLAVARPWPPARQGSKI